MEVSAMSSKARETLCVCVYRGVTCIQLSGKSGSTSSVWRIYSTQPNETMLVLWKQALPSHVFVCVQTKPSQKLNDCLYVSNSQP